MSAKSIFWYDMPLQATCLFINCFLNGAHVLAPTRQQYFVQEL
jgi:hypothetical protein